VSSDGPKRYDTDTQPFILKLWLEEPADESGKTLWRGCITHVPSRTTRYFQDFDQLTRFLISYLRAWGADLDPASPDENALPGIRGGQGP
jgi:hypothetical protein